jgi:phage terminase large subunit GpA-like protein
LLKPKPRLNIWQWAEKYRYVAKGVSAKTLECPRLYSTADAPHQKKMLESPTDPTVQTTIYVGASQVMGKTEVFNCILGYHMDWEPRSAVVMYPQLDSAEKYSKKKFTPMVEATPCLSALLRPARTRDSGNTILVKDFRGGAVYFVGANSPASLRGASGAVLLGDECDSNPPSCGNEGDPIELLFKRGESFPRCVQLLASTPTIKGQSRIWEWFEISDQQYWHVPCAKCGAHQVLTWKQIVWPKGEPEKCELICSVCSAALNDRQRLDMYYAGEWRATAPFRGVRGFHLNGIYVPWPCKKGFQNRLHQMAEDHLRAVKKGEAALQVWTNTFLCELWEVCSEMIEHKPLLERAESYTPEKVPAGVIIVIASIDVQGDRIECESIGLGEDDETWGIEYRKFYGDTEQDEVWTDLANHLAARKYLREDGAVLPITATAIDTRHKPHKVRAFAKRSGVVRVFPVYGVGGDSPILVTTKFNKHYRLRTFAVCDKQAKDTLFARLRIVEEGPRFMHYPKGQGFTEEYFLQLTAEVLKKSKVRGVVVSRYEKVRERNEALDIRKYFLAAVDILKPNLTAIAKHLAAGLPEASVKEYQLKPAGDGQSPDSQSPKTEPAKAGTPNLPAARVPKGLRARRAGRGGFVSAWRK